MSSEAAYVIHVQEEAARRSRESRDAYETFVAQRSDPRTNLVRAGIVAQMQSESMLLYAIGRARYERL